MAYQKTPSYLWQHTSGAWFLKRPVPPGLRHHYVNDATGKPRSHLVEPLGTHSRVEAEKLKRPRLSQLEDEFERLANGGISGPTAEHPGATLAALRQDMAEVHAAGGDEGTELVIEDLAKVAAETLVREHGQQAGTMAYRLATQPHKLTLREALADRHKGASTRKQTQAAEVKALEDLLAFLKVADCLPEDVTIRHALAFVDALNDGCLSHATKKGRLSCLGRLWATKKVKAELAEAIAAEEAAAHDERRKVRRAVPVSNPWREHDVKGEKRSTAEDEDDTGRNWTPAELVKVFDAPAPKDKRQRTYTRALFRELYALGLITGMRLDEITSLRPADVSPLDGGIVLSIPKAKSNAGKRSIPILHPVAVAILQRRTDAQTKPKGLIFSECVAGGPDHKTSWHVSKALGKDRARLKLQEVNFHSTRGNFMTLQENAGTNYVHVQRYVGHVIDTVMHTDYSEGAAVATLKAIAAAVRYSEDVEVALTKAVRLED